MPGSVPHSIGMAETVVTNLIEARYPSEAPRRSDADPGRCAVTAEMAAPAWMHQQITAELYDSLSAESYRVGDTYTGVVEAMAPFPVKIDLTQP